MTTLRWFLPTALASLALLPVATVRAGEAKAPADRLTFERDVRPILKTHCFQCHGEEGKAKASLDLRLVRSILKGGESGEAVVAGQHEESLLWERIDADEMPPGENKKLSARQKATISAWIDQGAAVARPEPASMADASGPTEEEQSFWSFQPVRRADPPALRSPDRVRTPIDAFLLDRLETAGLGFSPEADRRTLIRRLTFDLTGLPPTPEEVDAFLGDNAPDAYERLVDRLLASTRYGERWARHWLDVAGYADSDGYTTKDAERKYAYKYRDYVVRSLNADRPWDALIREQLAGDELVGPPGPDLSPGDVERLTATGFLRMAPDGTGEPQADSATARNDVTAETVKIVSTALLGLTVGCAQCHSHRYDPISHEDYYRFRALFEPAYDPTHWRTPAARLVSLWTGADRARAAEVDAKLREIAKKRAEAVEALVKTVLERELAAAPEDLREPLRAAREAPRGKRTDEQERLLKAYPRVNVSSRNVSLYDARAFREITTDFDRRTELARAKRPAEDFVQALTEVPGAVPVTHLLARGDVQQPRQAVEPGELSVLAASAGAAAISVDDPALPTTGRRLAYARHLTSGRHPLVARVLVNRVWLHHFGRGLVETPGDFGALGSRPTHSELLDWLADEFVRGGWVLKPLHRLIVTSAAYRQSSRRTPALDAADPDNRWLGRMSVRRLEAEVVRDAILAASGRLNPTMFGPPVPVTPDEAGLVHVGVDTRDGAGRFTGKKVPLGAEEFRRSVYVQVRRSLPLSLLETFDAPAMAPNCDRRASTTVAPQSLLLINGEFVVAQSEAFAGRLEAGAGKDPAEQVRLAWRLALGAEPAPEEVAEAVTFLARQRDDFAAAAPESAGPKADAARGPTRRALATFCQALIGSNAFLYVD
jgi:mono/diheme cytochrome c family protein